MSNTHISAIQPLKINRNRIKRTAGRLRARGFANKVIAEQLAVIRYDLRKKVNAA